MVYTTNNITALTDTANSTLVSLYTITINSDQSRTINRASGTAGNYAAGQLYLTVSRNENLPATGRGGTVEEYKDKEGHVVLKRTFLWDPVAVKMNILSTYYIYDDLGNLAFVLPPLAGSDNTSGTPAQTTLDNLCYQYQYDQRNRLVQKKLPGRDWEYMLYNALDKVVATQDGNQRAANPQQFTFTKYDVQGREILSGIYTYSGTAGTSYRAAVQGNVANVTTYWETPTTTGTGYTSAAWPTSWTGATLSINYYDNYSFPNLPSQYSAPAGYSTQTTGLLTASQTNILGTTNMLWQVNYYDGLGRLLQSYKQHNQGGGATLNAGNYDVAANTYDFTNAILATTRKHYNAAISTSAPAVTIANTYAYDHMGRRTQAFEQINGGTNVVVSQLDYNEIGQLLTKHLHSTNSGSSFLQNVAYTYNERSWLQSANAPLFSEQLQYNTGTNKQYNGNIAYQLYQSAATPATTTYAYTYDQLNRLTSGTSSDNYNESGISYDLEGNITALQRTYGSATVVDNLAYSYGGTNQVQSISDASADMTAGKFYPKGTFAYTYDPNGNIWTDASKGITTNISYNLLNLPAAVTANGKTATFTYDAAGRKLRKVSAISGVNTDYIDGIQYEAGAISFAQTEEGRALNSSGNYHYEYSLTDHLGNSRLTFDTYNGSASTVQQDDYLPFGYEISRGTVTSPKNEYLYNKKELQEDLVLEDYGARFYDPLLERWTTVDPLAEEDRATTPYSYTFDDPIRHTDPDGMFGEDANDGPGDLIQPTSEHFRHEHPILAAIHDVAYAITDFYRIKRS